MKKAVLILIIVTIISKVFGFLRDITLAFFYGASAISDAFLISLTIPAVLFGIIAAGISTGYIPMYSRIEANLGEKESTGYTNNLINILLLFCTMIIGLGFIFAESLVKLFASGFTGDTLSLAVMLTRISILGIYFTIITRILSAYLNYKKLFSVPGLLGIPMNIVLISFIVLSYQMDEAILLAIGYVIALFIQFMIVVFFSYRKGFSYRFIIDVKDKHMKEMLTLAVPVIIGSSVTQINKLVDRTLASQISEGGVSALNYAHTIDVAFLGIFVASVSTVLYPEISRMAAKGNISGLKNAINRAITAVSLLIIPVTIGSLLFAEPVVQFLYGRGAFDEQAVAMTSTAFFFYAIGMIGAGLRVLLSRAFYSLQDTKTPMINAAIAMGLNIILNFILAPLMGLGGLALATSLSSLFCTMLLFISLRKNTGALGLKSLLQSFIKILAASVAAGFISLGFYHYILPVAGENISLIGAGLIILIIYGLLIYVMKIDTAKELLQSVRNRLGQ
jgi:putative peptidoglycan lipid II flippase